MLDIYKIEPKTIGGNVYLISADSEKINLDSASPDKLKFSFTLLYVGTNVPEGFENRIAPEVLFPDPKL